MDKAGRERPWGKLLLAKLAAAPAAGWMKGKKLVLLQVVSTQLW